MAVFFYESELSQPKILIRSAVAGDAAAVVEYFTKIVKQTQNLTMTSDELYVFDDEEAFLERMEVSHNSIVLLALYEHLIVGCITFIGGHSPAVCHQGELGITVDKNWWGKGIGTTLMKALLSWAKAAGISKVNLQVRKDNYRAITVYKKFYFSLEAVQKGRMCVEGELIDLLWFGLPLSTLPIQGTFSGVDLSKDTIREHSDSLEPCTIRPLYGNDAAAVLVFAEQLTQAHPELFTTTDIPGVGNSLTEQQVLLSSHKDTPHWNYFGAISRKGYIVALLTCESGTRIRTKHAASCSLSMLPDWEFESLGVAMVTQLVTWAQSTSLQRLETRVLKQESTLISAFLENGFENEGTISRSMVFLNHYYDTLLLARYFTSM